MRGLLFASTLGALEAVFAAGSGDTNQQDLPNISSFPALLSSGYIQVAVNATSFGKEPNNRSFVFVSSLRLQISAFSGPGVPGADVQQGQWTQNLLGTAGGAAKGFTPDLLSTSAVLLDSGEMACPHFVPSSSSLTSNASHIVLKRLRLGEELEEDWTLSLSPSGTSLLWLRTVSTSSSSSPAPVPSSAPSPQITADRMALVLGTVDFGASKFGALGSQVPSFLDLDLFMNGTRGFAFQTPSSFSFSNSSSSQSFTSAAWREFLSPNTEQKVLLTPSGLELSIDVSSSFSPSLLSSSSSRCGSRGCFSFAKPGVDGTATRVWLGVQSLNRSSPSSSPTHDVSPYTFPYSTSINLTVPTAEAQLRHGVGSPYAKLDLELPPALQSLSDGLQLFARVQNQELGFLFGNNPASVTCLHEMAWFPWIQTIFAPGSPSQQALKQQLSFLSSPTAINASGYVQPRWNSDGFYSVEWGPLIDQVPHFILAVHGYAALSGDAVFLRSVEGALDRAAGYLMRRGMNATSPNPIPGVPLGVFTTTSSGRMDGSKSCTNWYDIIHFGGADAYTAAYAAHAVHALVEIKTFLGRTEEARQYQLVWQRAKLAYAEAFWSEAEGHLADWVDADGQARHYLYTDHQHLAVAFELVNVSLATRIFQSIDQQYSSIQQAFNLSRDDLWATPCSLKPIPLSHANDTVKGHYGKLSKAGPQWGSMPAYEIGGSFFHSVGLEALARGWKGGGGEGNATQALGLLQRFMNEGFAHNRGWAQQLFWNKDPATGKGTLVGSDPLNDSLLAVWGALQGAFGLKISLARVELLGTRAPASLEGARWTFSWRGQPFCVVVRDGVSQRCKID